MKKKKLLAWILMGSLAVMSLSGCKSEAIVKKGGEVQKSSAVDSVKKEFTAADLEEIVSGIEKHYVLKNAKSIDYMHNVLYDEAIIRRITVDSSKVDLAKVGTYTAIYTAEVYENQLTAYLEGKEIEADPDSEEKIVKIELPTEFEVIEKDMAQSLADKGKIVWCDKNECMPKEDGTKIVEKTEEPESTAKKDDDKQTASSGKKEKKDDKTAQVSSTTKPSDTSSSKPNSNTSKPSNQNSTSTSGTEKPGNTSKPSESKPSHSHTWVEQTQVIHHEATGHYEQVVVQAAWTEQVPIYEMVAVEICGNCGADCTADPAGHIKEHMLNGTGNAGTHTEYRNIQTGTETVEHPAVYEQKWIQDQAAYDETKVTGYVCSGCGAKK